MLKTALKMEDELQGHYANLYEKHELTDEWYDVKPAVPFVGSAYGDDQRPKVMVYASAENLNFEFDRAEMRFDRNRRQFELWASGVQGGERRSKDNWFPWLHMKPVSDGTLLTAARYVLDVFKISGFDTGPSGFLQQVAVGNYGKFSLKGKKNRDYASKPNLLQVSREYVNFDLNEAFQLSARCAPRRRKPVRWTAEERRWALRPLCREAGFSRTSCAPVRGPAHVLS